MRLRKKAGLKQVEAAEKAGLSSSQLSRYEAGTASPTLRTLGRLLDVYGADLDQLAQAVRESRLEANIEWLKSGLLYLEDWKPSIPDLSGYKEICAKLAEQCSANTAANLQSSIAQSFHQIAKALEIFNTVQVTLPSPDLAAFKVFQDHWARYQALSTRQEGLEEGQREFHEDFEDEEREEDDPEPAPSTRSKTVGAGQGINRRG